jgi:hypothetical protein
MKNEKGCCLEIQFTLCLFPPFFLLRISRVSSIKFFLQVFLFLGEKISSRFFQETDFFVGGFRYFVEDEKGGKFSNSFFIGKLIFGKLTI